MAQVKLLKELGNIMAAKESLERELATLAQREAELMRLLRATERDRTASIRDAIEDTLRQLRNDGGFWIPPRRIIALVRERVPGALSEEITYQLRSLATLEGSNIAHNGERGRGSAYFYVGLDQ